MGFSLIETALAVLIVSIIIGIVMTIYSSSNKYAAKGTWRIATISRQRLCLRQVKDYLERSSYPSVIQVANFFEGSPTFGTNDYVMQLGAGTPVASTTGTLQDFAFTAPGPILTFYACTPRQELEGIDSLGTVIPGKASLMVLSLESTSGASSAMRLVVTSSTAEVALSGNSVSVGTATSGATIPLLDDVAQVTVGVAPGSATTEKTVVEFAVETADPFDKKLRVHENARATVNVRIKQ